MKRNTSIRMLLLIMLSMALVLLTSAAFAETLNISVFRGDPGDVPSVNNKIYKLMEKELGVKFDFEFLSGDLDDTIGLKLQENKYPDLFDGGNSAELLIEGAALIDLLPYISEDKTPNLYKHIYTDNRIDQLKSEDGKLYIIPNYGINYNKEIVNSNGGSAFFIQKQVIAWNNYQVPKTLDEYFDLIDRYIAVHPTDQNGNPYTGFSIMCEDWRHFCLINPVQHLMGRPNDGEVLVDQSDLHTETFINQPYAKAYYAKLNEQFQKGIISEDTFTMNYDQYIASISSGTVLGMFDQAWDFGSATSALYDAGMDENTFLALPIVYDPEYVNGQQIQEHYLNGSGMNENRGFGISVTCENPEKMVQLFDTLLSDRWQTILQWGIEGEDYYIENGRMNMTPEQVAHLADPAWCLENRADAIFSALPKKQGTMDNGNAWDPQSQAEIYFSQMSDYDRAFLTACGKLTPAQFFNEPVKLAPYGEAWQIDYSPVDIAHQDFLDIQDKQLPELIMADPAQFDALWDKFVADITPSATEFGNYMQEQILAEARRNGFDPNQGRAQAESFVERSYELILGRKADEDGKTAWTNLLVSQKSTAAEIIDGFVRSAEFVNRNVTPEEAVDILYKTMLDREADAGGKAGWVDALNQGYTLQNIIDGFCGSAEFTTICKEYGIEPGSLNAQTPAAPDSPRGKIEAFVKRCYEQILGRTADEGGLKGWSDALESHQAAAANIIDGFVRSPEFVNQALSSDASVDILYKTMLNREADAGGKAGWVDALSKGFTFQNIINGFCGSAEFTAMCTEYGITAGSVNVAMTSVLMAAIRAKELPDVRIGTAVSSDEEGRIVVNGYEREEVEAFIRHGYEGILGREADEEGLKNLTAQIMDGTVSLKDSLQILLDSEEMEGRNLSDREYVEMLYKTYLNRDTDEVAEILVAALENGVSREEIVADFGNTSEFRVVLDGFGL